MLPILFSCCTWKIGIQRNKTTLEMDWESSHILLWGWWWFLPDLFLLTIGRSSSGNPPASGMAGVVVVVVVDGCKLSSIVLKISTPRMPCILEDRLSHHEAVCAFVCVYVCGGTEECFPPHIQRSDEEKSCTPLGHSSCRVNS